MHVVLSADNNYARPLAVTMMSVLCNRRDDDDIFFHVLDGGIHPGNRHRIIDMVTARSASIEFLSIPSDLFSGMSLNITAENHISLAAYYRLLIPSLIKADRCIYMDCDMICRTSLAPLWNTPLDNNLAGAVKDIDEDKQRQRLGLRRYFNSGLFLMNLRGMREESCQEKFFHFIKSESSRIVMHDQDVLNCVLHNRIYELDMTWNCQVCKTHQCHITGFYDLSKNASILHFIGHKKPWMFGCTSPMSNIYKDYFKYIPFSKLKYSLFMLLNNLYGENICTIK